ncbi:hypothetical protein [Curtobacterium sp. ISL-83]|uniref:hypothetical protein n=1 Tax=Curtobacterium sp. ISL-83 TaxID=2819145 RepID=UPI001BE72806|nr:hypothetical protein [Curtobacterium sp. ISL-83]MBT2502747.1 hypothetical protein [Curtobacterium sp. ISL-83]
MPEFEESLRDASPFETAILRDGVITAAELEEAQERKRVCMLDAGIRWKIFDDGTSEGEPVDGSALGSTEDVNATLQRCSRQFDRSVTYLFNEVRRNPEKQDDATITVACLRDAGVVGADYTERRWREENDSGAFAFNQWDPAATQCRLDPLGLWRR